MFRHLRILPLVALLFASLMALPMSKNTSAADLKPPRAVSADSVLFAHINVKAIRESAVVKEVKDALAKEKMSDLWDKAESDAFHGLGFKPTDLDSVTICVTEVSPREGPKFILILASGKPFDKPNVVSSLERRIVRPADKQKVEPQKPNQNGLYTIDGDNRLHFPDDKTAVIFHPDLAEKYLAGFAKDRKTWPLTAELAKAASAHTLFATANIQKLPIKDLPERALEEFGPLVKTQFVTFAADLKAKELAVGAWAIFPDGATASQAKESIQEWIDIFVGGIARFTKKNEDEIDFLKPLFTEARRALREAKIDAPAADVTLSGQYKIDFDIPKLVAELVQAYRETVPRMQAMNNFKQCALALHNIHSAYEKVVIHTANFTQNGDGKGLSWRVAMLPYIEQDELYKQFKMDEPWDSENNKKLIEKMPKLFAPVLKPGDKPGKPGYTHMQMVIGPKALTAGTMTLTGITDGTSNTIALVEAADPVIWTKPDDVMLPDNELPKNFRKKFGGQFEGGFHAAMWDGSVGFIPDKVSDRTLGFALDPNDGNTLGDDWEISRKSRKKR